MQDGWTPAFKASRNGHTETVALLLANKADINAANKVQQFKIFKYLKLYPKKKNNFFYFKRKIYFLINWLKQVK